jgi:hypothetical protein
METLLDNSSLPDLFYSSTLSEELIACAFNQKYRKLYNLLEKGEKALLPLDYQFEKENAIAALHECGEVELEEWLTSSLSNFSAWRAHRDY